MGSSRVGKRVRRALLKLSGETLRGVAGESVDPGALARLGDEIGAALRTGVRLALVVGGGNIIRGSAGGGGGVLTRITGDYMGMLATVINSLAIRDALQHAGVEARVLSALDVGDIAEPAGAERARRHMKNGVVVIFAGGTGNPFFTTDTAAALRAAEIGADMLLKATKVDGVYSSDPAGNKRAVRYRRVSYMEAISKRLKVMDSAAFSLCMENRIPIVVFDFFRKGNIRRVLLGQPVGTMVS